MKIIRILPILFCVCLGLSTGRAQAEVYGLMHLQPGAGYQEREASLVEVSLRVRPNGSKSIDGPYTATPQQLLIEFRQYRPELQLNGLANYIRSLVPGAAKPGRYDTSYIESHPFGIHTQGWPMTLNAETTVLYDGDQMVQVEGGGGVNACGNILYKQVLRTIAHVSVKTALPAPTPVPTSAPTPVAEAPASIDCYVEFFLPRDNPVRAVHIQVYSPIRSDERQIPTEDHQVPLNAGQNGQPGQWITTQSGRRLFGWNTIVHLPSCGVVYKAQFHFCFWNGPGGGWPSLAREDGFMEELKEEYSQREILPFNGKPGIVLNKRQVVVVPMPRNGLTPFSSTGMINPRGYPQTYGRPIEQGYPLPGYPPPPRYHVLRRGISGFFTKVLVHLALGRRVLVCQVDRFGHRFCHY